jgi:hypothetical protein
LLKGYNVRINLNYVNAYLVEELIKANAIANIEANGVDVIRVRLYSGEVVAIHLIERDIDVRLITTILEANSQAKTATLFILWTAMLLPEAGEHYLPYDWMSALLALHGDKIYGYESFGSEIYIFPVHFDIQDLGLERFIRYGDPVNMAHLTCETTHTDSQHLRGIWRVADFERQTAKADHNKSQPGNDQTHRSPLHSNRNSMSAYYAVLGIKSDATIELIRKAYHQLAMQYHPDLNKTPEATERMQEINLAYTQIMTHFENDS